MSAWKETSDPQFFDQAMAWGREHKWQVGTEFAGANRLFCVEPVDFQPNAFQQDSTREYVAGAFLLAGSQVYRLAASQ